MKTDLQTIPGVGKNMEEHLTALGITAVAQLREADPEALYARDCARCGKPVDRCVLYVYRAAVYFASNERREPQKCNWWYWKD